MEPAADSPREDPRTEYERRLRAHREVEAAAARRGRRLSAARLLCALLILILLVLVGADDWSGHWVWPPAIGFVLLVTLHAIASQRELRAGCAARLYEDGLARLDGQWSGRGESGEAWAPTDHLYARDLDLFGRGSLFELLCVARTPGGQARLAAWLCEGAPPDAIRARQEAVDDLRPRIDYREDLALVEGEIKRALEHTAASTWGLDPPRLVGAWLPLLHAILGVASAVLLIGWLSADWHPLPMVGVMLVQFLCAAPLRTRVHTVLEAAERPARDLALTGRVLDRIEGASFASARLRALQARLAADGPPPSGRIRHLVRLMDFVDARRNQIFLPVSWLFSLGTQLAFAIERWRAAHGPLVATWVDVVAQIEALASLAGYAYEHPQDPFPEVLDDGATYQGEALGHPLLPVAACVANSVHLSGDAQGEHVQALIVSGSNMSGKSTFLRTVGVNAVLAQMGAPVRARSLRLSPLALGASIRIQDSLQEGASRFYAEIARLRRIVETAEGDRPVLFLLDEILHGTNSHDRRIGAEAVVHTLLDAGAIGLVTTHDLALAAMPQHAAGRLGNVHFEDHLDGERIAFDYTLRPGVVTHSNALALMRAVGLDVRDPAADD